MVTDRDIALRAVGQNRGNETIISDVMSPNVVFCFENDDLAAEDSFFTRPDNEIGEFFDQERMAGRIRNDDLAIVRIEIKERSMG